MPSPFPGMDPYIESCSLWEDFHDSLIAKIKNDMSERLPERYIVRSGERSYVVLTSSTETDERLRTQADIAIVSPTDSPVTTHPAAVLEKTTAPITMRALVETEFRESFIEIREVHPNRKLVTTIEILSPANKRFNATGWQRYQKKRQAHLEGQANLVEIDLLRGGHRMPMEDDWPDSPCYVLVARRETAPKCGVWPAFFRQSLPAIPIPLLTPDADLLVELQPKVNEIYNQSRYNQDIDYQQSCRPRLDAETRQWLQNNRLTSNGQTNHS